LKKPKENEFPISNVVEQDIDDLEEPDYWNNETKENETGDMTQLDEKQKQELTALISKYEDVFADEISDLKDTFCTLGEFDIKTTTKEPVFQYPYRKSEKEEEIIEQEVAILKENGIIRESTSPFSARTLTVLWLDKTSRLCIDYRG